MSSGSIRRFPPALVLAAAALGLAAACASIVGFPDVPNVSDAGDAAIDVAAESAPPTEAGGDVASPETGTDSSSDAETADRARDGRASEAATDAAKDATAADVAPSSCAADGNGLSTCPSGSCCTSLEVEGGTFYRTYTPGDAGASDAGDEASVSGFRLDQYDVTVGRFRQFVAAWDGGAGWLPEAGSGKHTHLNSGSGLSAVGGGYEPGWVVTDDSSIAATDANLAGTGADAPYATWTASPGTQGQENLPINGVNWYEAYAFCIWDGGFLPSEAEWEYAVAGGSQQREYPWGSTTPGDGNQYAIYGCHYPGTSGTSNIFTCTGVANIAPVGTASAGVGLWGQLDLEGDVLVWVLDWYAPTFVDPCSDCADVTNTGGTSRVVRGARWDDLEAFLVPSSRRLSRDPSVHEIGVGIRCARTP
jgi:formylglycine-generating enzyme required for sulfatase activity